MPGQSVFPRNLELQEKRWELPSVWGWASRLFHEMPVEEKQASSHSKEEWIRHGKRNGHQPCISVRLRNLGVSPSDSWVQALKVCWCPNSIKYPHTHSANPIFLELFWVGFCSWEMMTPTKTPLDPDGAYQFTRDHTDIPFGVGGSQLSLPSFYKQRKLWPSKSSVTSPKTPS